MNVALLHSTNERTKQQRGTPPEVVQVILLYSPINSASWLAAAFFYLPFINSARKCRQVANSANVSARPAVTMEFEVTGNS